MRVRRLAPVVLLAAAFGPSANAAAQAPPPVAAPMFGTFLSVLAQGEGQTVSAADLAANLLTGAPPATFVSQQPLYAGVMPAASTLTAANLTRYYKDTSFGAMPGGVGSHAVPRAGVDIYRDAKFGMAHVYGATRADVMFGAGYATAQERLFLMDALRHTAKGTLAELTGPSAAAGDASQLTDQDFSDAELTQQFDALPQRLGAEGARARQDILDYVEGINRYIDDTVTDPAKLPAEYAALGTRPARWTPSDSVAQAVLLVTQFTVSNGSEEINSELQSGFRKRLGRRWRSIYTDLRMAEDPEAFTVDKTRRLSDRPGKVVTGRNLRPDPGSIKPRNPLVGAPATSAARAALVPAWVRAVNGLKASLPHHASNAVLVSGRLSKTGRPLSAMGPQVSYYSPQIFSEIEMHGGGIDVEGVTFPGASPYPLIGHGIDFVWSGTSANGDNHDTFVETLCADESQYRYKGTCRPFITRDQVIKTPVSPLDPGTPSKTITYRTLRSVHGPIFATATVGGKKVVLAKAKAVNFHELDGVIAVQRMAENRIDNAAQFQEAFSSFPGTENWFYADNRQIAFQQSGRYPRHAKGTDVDVPLNGDGSADWQSFNPDAYTFDAIPDNHRPAALEPKDGYIVSWNNKEARGWRKGPAEWSGGPVQRAQILQRRLVAERKRAGGKVDLPGLARAVNLAATTDLRATEDLPWLLRVIGPVTGEDGKLTSLLSTWNRLGGRRIDLDDDNVYEQSAAVALFDAWWPRLVRAEFQPTLGKSLFNMVVERVLGLDRPLNWDWAPHVQKDMRKVLGHTVPGWSRAYCGTRRACRAMLLHTLRQARADATRKYGSSEFAAWKVPALCSRPVTCDQLTPNTAGAIDTPAFPWQNRGTYHQVAEIRGHR